MSRNDRIVESAREPFLIYLRREHGGAPVELVIIPSETDGREYHYIVSDPRLLRMVADGASMLATRPQGSAK